MSNLEQNHSQTHLGLLMKNEKFRFEIRKQKLNKTFEEKRLKIFGEADKENIVSNEENLETTFLNCKIAISEAIKPQLNGNNIPEIVKQLEVVLKKINIELDRKSRYLLKIMDETGLFDIVLTLLNPNYFNNLELMNFLFWILINATFYCDDYFWKKIKEAGIIDSSIKIVFDPKSKSPMVIDAFWFLGNSLEESNGISEHLHKINFFDFIVMMIQKEKNETHTFDLIDHFIFAFGNFVRTKKNLTYNEIERFLPLFLHYIEKIEDWKIHHHCVSLLTSVCKRFLQEGPLVDRFIPMFKEARGYQIMRNLLEKTENIENESLAEELEVKITIIIGTISFSENPDHMDFLLQNGVLDLIYVLMGKNSQTVRANAGWILSNLTIGTSNQISKIMLHENLINRALYQMKFTPFIEERHNLMLSFNNSFYAISDFSLLKLITKGILQIYIEALFNSEENMSFMTAIFEGLREMFLALPDDKMPQFIEEFESYGGKPLLERFSYCENNILRETALQLFCLYYPKDQEVQ